jgi:SAM-dependent methyltransferase
MADAYDRWLVPTVFQPFAEELTRRVVALAPARVLEVAAGTGAVTRALVDALASCEVVATDLNQAMVDVGARCVPEARWQQADALSLPFADGEFDVAACQFGVMFFPDRARGLAEMGRVVSAEGSVLFDVWDTVDRHAYAAALLHGLRAAFPDDPPTFVASIPHGYSDADLIARDVVAAGMELVAIESVTLHGRTESVADVARGFCTGTPLRVEIEARGDLAETIEIVTGEMERRLGEGPFSGAMTAHVVAARRRIV